MNIKYKKKFTKNFEKLDKKVQEKTLVRINIFQKNPLDKTLDNHALTWEYMWYRSIDITWDYRAIFRENSNKTYEFVEFIDIWTHSQLYK